MQTTVTDRRLDPYNEVCLAHSPISSTRDRINVMTYTNGAMNNYFAPMNRRRKNESREDYLRRCVQETWEFIQPGWFGRITFIAIREDHSDRGYYHYTVWGTK